MSALDLFAVATQRATSTLRTSTASRVRRIAFNVTEGEDVRTITPAGRDAWALGELITAGLGGCTPIDHPGPRWSGYVHKLKRIYGLNVETITEMHGASMPGSTQGMFCAPRCDLQIRPTPLAMGAANELQIRLVE